MLRAIITDMGLDDATIHLEPPKLLVYRTCGRFSDQADTEKSPEVIPSASLIVPAASAGGALGVEHAGERLRIADHCISPLFGTLRAARCRDAKHFTHFNRVYARKGTEEAPKNSISTVPLWSWEDQGPGAAQACGD